MAFAQMEGWPWSTHGSKTVSSDETWCTDRARVTNASGSGPYTLTLTDFNGSFSQFDWLMIIQMDGSGIGNYSMVNVLTAGTTSGPTASLSVEPYLLSPYFNVWPTLSFGTNDRVQVVKVSRFWDLTVTAGRITCPAYDVNSGTGGILAVMVGHDFVMSGGYFDVHAKGFYPHFPSGGTGSGGAGAAGRTTHTPGVTVGSNSASVDDPAYTTAYVQNSTTADLFGEPNGALEFIGGIPTSIWTSYNGQNGGLPNNTGAAGSSTSGEVNYVSVSGSSYPSTLIMGASGTAGANGGAGGGGGGKGGSGGNSNFTTNTGGTAFPGDNGNPGESGGNAGAGGKGGGILYLKVANSDLSGLGIGGGSGNPMRFIASGSQGANGGNAGDGGMGGDGGLGAYGDCVGSAFVTPGGIGGNGDGGRGGNGGDAGSGGKGGPIWIIKKVGGTHSTFAPVVNNLGGKGGRGGAPGYTPMHQNTRRPRNYNGGSLGGLTTCNGGNFDHAPGLTLCPPIVCDCDPVFDHLGNNLAGTVSLSGSTPSWTISNGNPAEDVHWDATNFVLYYESITLGCTTRYECRMKLQATYGEFMDKVVGITDLETYSAGGSPGIDAISMSSGKTQLLAPGGHIIMEYDPTQDRMYDLDNITKPYVDVDVCPFDYTVQSGGSSGGGGGQVPDDDVLIERTPTGNYGADAGGTPVNGDQEETSADGPVPLEQEMGIMAEIITQAKPNEISVVNAGGKLVHYELYALTGQKLASYSSHQSLVIPVNAAGIYILRLRTDVQSTTRKIYIP